MVKRQSYFTSIHLKNQDNTTNPKSAPSKSCLKISKKDADISVYALKKRIALLQTLYKPNYKGARLSHLVKLSSPGQTGVRFRIVCITLRVIRHYSSIVSCLNALSHILFLLSGFFRAIIGYANNLSNCCEVYCVCL